WSGRWRRDAAEATPTAEAADGADAGPHTGGGTGRRRRAGRPGGVGGTGAYGGRRPHDDRRWAGRCRDGRTPPVGRDRSAARAHPRAATRPVADGGARRCPRADGGTGTIPATCDDQAGPRDGRAAAPDAVAGAGVDGPGRRGVRGPLVAGCGRRHGGGRGPAATGPASWVGDPR